VLGEGGTFNSRPTRDQQDRPTRACKGMATRSRRLTHDVNNSPIQKVLFFSRQEKDQTSIYEDRDRVEG